MTADELTTERVTRLFEQVSKDERLRALRSAVTELMIDLTELGTHRGPASEPNGFIRGLAEGKAVACRTSAQRLAAILDQDLAAAGLS